jgi:hypothetical protein
MEGDVDSRKGNSCDTTLQRDIAALHDLLLLGNLEAVVDNLLQHVLDFLDGEGLQELVNTVRGCYALSKSWKPPYLLKIDALFLRELRTFVSLQSQKVTYGDVL